MKPAMTSALLVILSISSPAALAPVASPAGQVRAENVVLVTFDGLRWQELFGGADEALMNQDAGRVSDPEQLRATFWRPTPEERRRLLLPFFWNVIAARGQVFGNARMGSEVKVTNGRIFSYPGYNEMLAGYADDRIDSNAKRANPNVTVLEWLNGRPGFEGRVAAFSSWDVFPYIINEARSGVVVNSGWEPLADPAGLSPREELLNELMVDSFHPSEAVRDDAMTFYAALEYLRKHQPRVLYISFDRTDAAAHNGRYDRYLRAAQQTDHMLELLWNELQSLPRYVGSTALLVTTDHGRGGPPLGWRDHGDDVPGAELIWLAAMGPDTPAAGDRANTGLLTQSQVAATLAALVGEDYRAEVPRVAPGILEVLHNNH